MADHADDQMTTTTSTWENLGVRDSRVQPGDFARLGIGDREARVSVIRRAAAAASAAVASKEDEGSVDQSDEKLAQIATSTYRLLDPRGRDQIGQRVQLLHFESAPAKVNPWWKWKPTDVAQETPRDNFDPTAASDSYEPSVTRDRDNLIDLTKRLTLPLLSRKTAIVGVSLVGSFFAVGLLLLCMSMFASDDSEIEGFDKQKVLSTPSATAEAPEIAVPVEEASEVADESAESSSNAVEVSLPEVPLSRDLLETVKSEVADFVAPEPESMVPGPFANVVEDFAKMEAAKESLLLEPEAEIKTEPIVMPELTEAAPKVKEDVAGMHADLLASEEVVPGIEMVQPPVDARELKPSPDDIETAMQQLQRIMAEEPGPSIDSTSLVSKLRVTSINSPLGSADRWVLLREICQLLILAGKTDQADQTVRKIGSEFQASALELRSSLLESVVDRADAITQKERVALWALETSELALLQEKFDEAVVSARVATSLAIELGDATLRQMANSHSDALKQAKRMMPVASKVLSDENLLTASSKSANSAGRYLCLYLRDWERGLPWLAQSSNPKLAKAAREELDLVGDDAEATIAVTNAWIELSKDLRGRTKDSIVFHAQDLVSRSLRTATGLKAEDLKRQLELIEKLLPVSAVSPSNEMQAPQDVTGFEGMLGVMKADGVDIDVLIRYSPGLVLSRTSLSGILDDVGLRARAISLEFVGFINIAEDTTVRFVAGRINDNDDSVKVSVGNDLVKLSRDGQTNRLSGSVDLSAGSHLVQWQFGGLSVDNCHLTIVDDRSGDMLKANHSQVLLEQVGGAKPRRKVSVIGLD